MLRTMVTRRKCARNAWARRRSVKAAESMQLPKPTVTRLIQSLEEHLSVKLLNRTTRRVSVTSEGAAYYDRASRLLGELDELESSVVASRSAPKAPTAISSLATNIAVGLGDSVSTSLAHW